MPFIFLLIAGIVKDGMQVSWVDLVSLSVTRSLALTTIKGDFDPISFFADIAQIIAQLLGTGNIISLFFLARTFINVITLFPMLTLMHWLE